MLTLVFRQLTLASMEKRKTTLLIIISIVVIVIVATLFALWTPPPPAPSVVFPSPNGYESFMQAGAQVQKQTGDFAKISQEDLRNLVEANSNALQIARVGLAEKSRVPVEFSQTYISAHMENLARMKLLAYAFVAEGRLAEMEQRTNDAVRCYLDAARLGVELRRGGVLIDTLVGFGTETIGEAPLQKLVPNLDAKTSAEAARELETLNADKETWEQILQNEKYWSRRTFPGLQYRIAALFTSSETKAAKTKARQRYDAQQAKADRLMLDLAARAYQLDKGHRPASVSDLVPAYLKAAPIDPATGKEMTLTP